MERAERVVVLCAGLAFSVLLVPLLWVMLGLTLVTAVQRFVKVWRQATAAGAAGSDPGAEPAHESAAPGPTGTGASTSTAPAVGVPELAVTARWRAWREANGWAPREPRYSPSAQQAGAAERWRERRRSRLAAEGRPAHRRSGTRRP
jgi:hypothetical protein